MKIDNDSTKAWWLRFDTDDLVYADELIDFVMFHKVQGSSEYTVDEKDDILTAWEVVRGTLWEKEYDY